MKCLKDILTERDGETFELSAILAAFTVLAFVAMSVWKMYQTHQFDPISYGTGASAIIRWRWSLPAFQGEGGGLHFSFFP